MATLDGNCDEILYLAETILFTLIPDPNTEKPISTVTVSQTIEYDHLTIFGHSARLSQAISLSTDLTRSPVDELILTQDVTGVLIYGNRGNSGHGGSSFLDPAAQVVYDNLNPSPTVKFSYNTTEITLRAPDWGDKDKYTVVRIQEESRGRSLIVFQDPIWPRSEVLSLTFSFMTQVQADNLLSFIRETLGIAVNYYDHLGRHWLGFILTPDAEVRQTGRNNRTITLEYQGEIQ